MHNLNKLYGIFRCHNSHHIERSCCDYYFITPRVTLSHFAQLLHSHNTGNYYPFRWIIITVDPRDVIPISIDDAIKSLESEHVQMQRRAQMR